MSCLGLGHSSCYPVAYGVRKPRQRGVGGNKGRRRSGAEREEQGGGNIKGSVTRVTGVLEQLKGTLTRQFVASVMEFGGDQPAKLAVAEGDLDDDMTYLTVGEVLAEGVVGTIFLCGGTLFTVGRSLSRLLKGANNF